MSPVLRNLLRTFSLLGAIALLAFGMLTGAISVSPTEPPNDGVWLLCLGVAFPLLLVYAWLSVAGNPGLPRPTPEVGDFVSLGGDRTDKHKIAVFLPAPGDINYPQVTQIAEAFRLQWFAI